MKRLLDIVLSLAALLVLSPLMLGAALAIALESGFPVLFRQTRLGLHGREFGMFKFRSMVKNAAAIGPYFTSGDDPRITRVGRFIRRTSIDELPQILNVLKGDMSLVGPRPEVPRYMALYPDEARRLILSVRPGVTDRATIEFRDEERLLAAASDPERAYVEQVMPIKQRYYLDYVARRSLAGDVGILIDTLRAVLGRADS